MLHFRVLKNLFASSFRFFTGVVYVFIFFIKTLSVNAAKDSADLVAKLRAYHNSSQTKKVKIFSFSTRPSLSHSFCRIPDFLPLLLMWH